MQTFYLIDFENVHNDGIANIKNLTKEDHVHIFSTRNAVNIRQDVFWLDGDIQSHLVPVRKQSLDMYLVSYLGYILGVYGKQCKYVIVSKDRDYDNIINFWKEKGYSDISRKPALPNRKSLPQKTSQQMMNQSSSSQTVNSKISAGLAYQLSGDDRSELNHFMQHGLIDMGYKGKNANMICKYVVAHCNDERILSGIHNDLREIFEDYEEVYEDVKSVLEKFVNSKSKSAKSKNAKRESQVRSFFGQHFKKKLYIDCKEEIIAIILNAKTRQQVNNGLMKLYSDGNVVKHIYQTLQPLIQTLPGR